MSMACDSAGVADPDIGGEGVLIAFAVQALISFVLSFYCLYLDSPLSSRLEQNARIARKRHVTNEILFSASDNQSILGISLLLSALIQSKTLSLYHFHIVYDTVSFTSISHIASVCMAFHRQMKYKAARWALVGVASVLYVSYVAVFSSRLTGWDNTIPGHCYDTSLTAKLDAHHPRADATYITYTASYLFVSFSYTILAYISKGTGGFGWWGLVGAYNKKVAKGQRRDGKRVLGRLPGGRHSDFWNEASVLGICMWQFPVHLYFLIAIRVSNSSLLEGPESESDWGFAQILAVGLLATNLFEVVKGFREYYRWKKEQQRSDTSQEDSGGMLRRDSNLRDNTSTVEMMRLETETSLTKGSDIEAQWARNSPQRRFTHL